MTKLLCEFIIMNYQQKYIKYKNKYLNLKQTISLNQLTMQDGGAFNKKKKQKCTSSCKKGIYD